MNDDNTRLIYGRHAAGELLQQQPDSVFDVWIHDGRNDRRLSDLSKMARATSANVHRVSRATLDEKTSGGRHQGIILRCRDAGLAVFNDVDGLLDAVGDAMPLVLVLDGVQDPQNLGACLRNAAAAGAHGVVIPKNRAVGLTPVVRKVASGAAERVPVVRVSNLVRSLEQLQARGVTVVGAAGEADKALFDCELDGPLALVLGGEHKGLRRLTREHCDQLANIPMPGSMESLNVAAASAVCLYEAIRQRSAGR